MTLVSYEPWSFVNRLQRELNQAFNKTSNTAEVVHTPSVAWIPRVDIYEESERFVVLADVPGVDAKDIDITAENGVLTIKGERRSDRKDTDKNGYERIERTSGSFVRRFTLPGERQHREHQGEADQRRAGSQHSEAAAGPAPSYLGRSGLSSPPRQQPVGLTGQALTVRPPVTVADLSPGAAGGPRVPEMVHAGRLHLGNALLRTASIDRERCRIGLSWDLSQHRRSRNSP